MKHVGISNYLLVLTEIGQNQENQSGYDEEES